MNTECQSSDIISTLPQNIIDTILTLMPIKDALRTSILSKKWRYSWRSMPKLIFTDDMVEVSFNSGRAQLEKYKFVSAIFHVLFLHNGPTSLKFGCSIGLLNMDSDFALIMSFLARENKVKELIFANDNLSYKLPLSFFLLQGLEHINLAHCTFEPSLTFNGFSRLKYMKFYNVKVSAQMLQRFLSKSPLLEDICLIAEDFDDIDFLEGGNKFTFIDMLNCIPLVRSLDISIYYMKYFSVDGMPRKLPTSLLYLKHMFLDVCLMEQNEINSVLCIIKSSPMLEKVKILMYDDEKASVRQTPTYFLNIKDHLDLKLDHLEILEIEWFRNLFSEREFVKLIMAKSPVLKKVQIKLDRNVSVDDELEMLREMVELPFPRASPSAKLIIERP